jgi:hypothetical protein
MKQFTMDSGDFVATTGNLSNDHPQRAVTLVYVDAMPTFQDKKLSLGLFESPRIDGEADQ